MKLLLLATAFGFVVPLHAQNLINNGDFEQASKDVPTGWVMWGPDAFKIPQNYVRDTLNPHSGAASLRIFHPANSGGYLAADPRSNSFPTARDTSYHLSFWAKSDAPSAGTLNIFGLKTLDPLSSETVLGTKIDLTSQWKQFEFRLDEGFDFDAATVRRLQVALSATSYDAPNVQRTLWVDDIKVTAQANAFTSRSLLDLQSVPYTPVEHRLQPGNELNITVDARKILRAATRAAEGVSFHRLQGYMGLPYNPVGEYKLTPAQETAIRELRPSHTRIYGLGDEPKFTLPQSIDNAAHLLERTGIAQDGSVLELEDQHAERQLSPPQWADAVRYSGQKGYAFRFWEISNEPYFPYQGHAEVFKTPADYIAHVRAVGPAIRGVQPGAQVGVEIYGIARRPSQNLKWNSLVLKESAGNYDFAAAHWYALIDASKNSFETVVAGENYRILDQVARTNALLKAYNPGRDVYQYDTEWSLYSMTSGDPATTQQNGNIVGALHRAVRLIYYVREDLVRGASAWEMFSQKQGWNALGVLAPEGDKKSMLYWTHRTFNEHTGKWVVQMAGTAPFYTPPADAGAPGQRPLPGPLTPALATLSEDGKTLFFTIVNASWDTAVPLTLNLANFPATSVSGVKLSNDDLNRSGRLDKKADFVQDFSAQLDGARLQATIPGHSAVFLTLKR